MRFNDIKKLNSGIGGTIGDYHFIYGLVSLLRPLNIVEIGTNTGVSSIVMALAMKENNIKGHIFTFDISQGYKKIADEQIQEMNVQNYITTYFGNSDNVSIMKYDLGFIDGDHTYEGVKKDFEKLNKLCNYILFHDTQVCSGVTKFIKKLQGEKINIINRPKNPVYNKGKLTSWANFPGITLWKKGD